MTGFVVFNPSTGEIQMVGDAPAHLIGDQGANVVEGDANLGTHYVDLDTRSIVQMPPRPSAYHQFDYSTKTWVLNLAQGQSIAWARVKAARDAAIAAGVTYNGNVYDSDATAQLRVTGAATMAQLAIASGDTAYSISWTLANNSTVVLTAQEVIAMAQAVGANYQTMFAKGQTLRAQIMAATTQAELDAVTW